MLEKKEKRVGRPAQTLIMPVIKGANDVLAVNDTVMVRTKFHGTEENILATIVDIRKRDIKKDGELKEPKKDPSTAEPEKEDTQQQPKLETAEDEAEQGGSAEALAESLQKEVKIEEYYKQANEEAIEAQEPKCSTQMDADSAAAKQECTDAGQPSSSKSSEDVMIYYVHYNGMDRRLDEWVDKSRILDVADLTDKQTPLPTPVEAPGGLLTRSRKRVHEEFMHMPKAYEDMDATTAKLEKQHEEWTKVKNIEVIQFGRYEIDTWYFAPYPSQFTSSKRLYICEYCLNYMEDLERYQVHMLHMCQRRQPPGDEIYRSGNISVFEVDGKINKTYCQNLCLLSKLFLDHKTLYFDVDTFLFYVLCEVDDKGAHMVGHFSKERMSEYNLACIMVLPPYQRRGYGKLLIQLSYCLSEREDHIGTPEKPLSDLGKVSYRSYWWWVLLTVLEEQKIDQNISVGELSRLSNIHVEDIISTFNTMQLIKYWKGDHVVRAYRRVVEICKKKSNLYKAPRLLLDKKAVRWSPTYQWNSH